MKRTGEVVGEYGPWLVAKPRGEERRPGRFIVIDTSGGGPHEVFGPGTRAECEAWARTSLGLLAALQGQTPEAGRDEL